MTTASKQFSLFENEVINNDYTVIEKHARRFIPFVDDSYSYDFDRNDFLSGDYKKFKISYRDEEGKRNYIVIRIDLIRFLVVPEEEYLSEFNDLSKLSNRTHIGLTGVLCTVKFDKEQAEHKLREYLDIHPIPHSDTVLVHYRNASGSARASFEVPSDKSLINVAFFNLLKELNTPLTFYEVALINVTNINIFINRLKDQMTKLQLN